MMLLASSVCGLFKWRQFEPEVILLAIGWYVRFSLSYRDVEELLAERGLLVDHVTVWRWVQRYAPEMERRLRSKLKPTNDSWRVDETYVRVKGKWVYLYRALDSNGDTIDFLLSARRDAAAAERFLAKASARENNHPAVRVINTDKHSGYPPAIANLQTRGDLSEKCQHPSGAVPQQHPRTGSSGHQTPVPSQSMVSFLLERPAHDCRLRSHSHDPPKLRQLGPKRRVCSVISLSASLPKKHEESPKLWIRFASTNLQHNRSNHLRVRNYLSLKKQTRLARW